MILCDSEISAALANGLISIDPLPSQDRIQTSAVDLTLGDEFLKWPAPNKSVYTCIDVTEDFKFADVAADYAEKIPLAPDGTIDIPPHTLILGMTRETIDLPIVSRLAARVEGRSTFARIGLTVHQSAPTVHSGFKGRITLEMVNNGTLSIRLRPGIRICQLIIEQVFGTPVTKMTGQFQNQNTPIGPTPDKLVAVAQLEPHKRH
jgi:dCTP deaminase